MTFLYLKALHIVFITTWFAGLFYVPRLFIYHIEASQKPEPDRSILTRQFKLMTKRLWYIIAWPSAIMTLILGGALLFVPPVFYFQNVPRWLWLKLALVLGLYAYHHWLHFIFKQLQQDVVKYSSQQVRYINEIGTLFLFGIIFLVVLRESLSLPVGLVGLVILMVLLVIGIIRYKKKRSK